MTGRDQGVQVVSKVIEVNHALSPDRIMQSRAAHLDMAAADLLQQISVSFYMRKIPLANCR